MKSFLRHRALIPNRAGYCVVVWLTDGSRVETSVARDERGLHHLDGVEIADVVGWLPTKEVQV